jgi:hypothetical protein
MCSIRSEVQSRRQVWLIAVEIFNQGIKPSEYRIPQQFSSTIVLIRPKFRSAIHEARARLGYND